MYDRERKADNSEEHNCKSIKQWFVFVIQWSELLASYTNDQSSNPGEVWIFLHSNVWKTKKNEKNN